MALLVLCHTGHCRSNYTDNYIHTSRFKIFTSAKIKDNLPLYVYIEGDGNAWDSKYKLSSDPTPRRDTVLDLAELDSHPNVLYIARPCQFLSAKDLKGCESKYWSKSRYSKEVIESISMVIDHYKKLHSTETIHLIGYSGGGTIASLLPIFRNDVLSVRTIAANLDHKTLSTTTKTSPLTNSLNPSDFINIYPKIPQHHIVGAKDELIDSDTILNFATLQQHNNCVMVSIFKNKHHNGWRKIWKNLHSEPVPKC